jgi:glycosyltransferase involved in cell wall biosynthesis
MVSADPAEPDPMALPHIDAAEPPGTRLDPAHFRYSIVIPVYNSEKLVGQTIDRVVEVFEEASLRYEVILVNDGSPDGSWQVISERARRLPHVVAVNLLRNYGQHRANLAGFRESTGDFVITMDDDLQNPPDQALVLIDAAMDGHDVVFGKFERKQAAGFRRIGSRLINAINRRIFGQPPDLDVSNFRILRRDVVDRICASRTAHPYITGQALLYSSDRANVAVRHEPRAIGKSNYSLLKILSLVFTILFSYSSYPLRAAALGGFALSALSFLLGGFYLVRGLLSDTRVEGWTTLVVLVSAFSGFIIALLSMIGEYVVRTLNTVGADDSYHVVEKVRQ